jgi:glycosyltransferase involved in cell wall biosynthesis
VNVLLAYYRIPHHGARSGYDQVARHVGKRVRVSEVEVQDVPRFIPAALRTRLVRQARQEWYDEWGLALEVEAARRLLAGREQICHFLYGEDSYRYFSSFRPLARLRRTKLVASFHQPPATFERVFARPSRLGRLDAVVALSRKQADHLGRYAGDRVFYVPHGVDTSFYAPAANGKRPGFTCLFVGSWLRDVDTLAAIVRVLAPRGDVAFDLVSADDRVQELEGLPGVTVRSGLPDHELLAAYRAADLLVLPLLDSTANNTILEGLACGLPVVTSAVGGIPDYVDDRCAELVPTGDVEAFCEAVVRLAGDDRKRAEMGRRSRERALELDWSNVANRLVDVYEQLA